MFRIFSRSTGQRDRYATRVQEVSVRSFATAINEPMLFQISDELSNLTRHNNNIIGKENCNEPVRELPACRFGRGVVLSCPFR
jgi:hypothetical protein